MAQAEDLCGTPKRDQSLFSLLLEIESRLPVEGRNDQIERRKRSKEKDRQPSRVNNLSRYCQLSIPSCPSGPGHKSQFTRFCLDSVTPGHTKISSCAGNRGSKSIGFPESACSRSRITKAMGMPSVMPPNSKRKQNAPEILKVCPRDCFVISTTRNATVNSRYGFGPNSEVT